MAYETRPRSLPTPQIYMPTINWFVGFLCIIITAAFGLQSSTLGEPIQLANAYGVAVSGTMFLTTCLITVAIIVAWEVSVTLG